MPVSHIIIPTTAHEPEMLQECISGLNHGAAIVLVVNTDDLEAMLAAALIYRSLLLAGRYATFVALPAKVGYVEACNLGFAAARPHDEDLVITLNDDTVLSGDILPSLWQAIANGASQVGGSVHHVGCDGLWGRGDEPYQYVEGWCSAALVGTIRAAGGLYDPQFSPGYCDDMDLSIRIQKMGGRVEQVALPIKHLRSQTFGQDKEPAWSRNREYLIRKWNLDVT